MTTVTRSDQTNLTPALAATGLSLALLIIVAGNYNVPAGENGGTGPAIITSIGSGLLTLGLFAWLLPRIKRPERTSMTLAILAIASLPVYWSGAGPILAAAAFASRTTHASRPTRTAQIAAGAAAGLALAAAIATSHL